MNKEKFAIHPAPKENSPLTLKKKGSKIDVTNRGSPKPLTQLQQNSPMKTDSPLKKDFEIPKPEEIKKMLESEDAIRSKILADFEKQKEALKYQYEIRLQQEIQKYVEENTTLKTQLQEAKQREASLNTNLVELESTFTSKIETLSKEHEASVTKLKQLYESEIIALKGKVDELVLECKKSMDWCAELIEKLKESKEQHQVFVGDVKKEIASIQEDIQNERTRWKAEIEEQKSILMEELKQKDRLIDFLHRERTMQETDLAALKNVERDMQSLLVNQRQQLADSQQRLRDLELNASKPPSLRDVLASPFRQLHNLVRKPNHSITASASFILPQQAEEKQPAIMSSFEYPGSSLDRIILQQTQTASSSSTVPTITTTVVPVQEVESDSEKKVSFAKDLVEKPKKSNDKKKIIMMKQKAAVAAAANAKKPLHSVLKKKDSVKQLAEKKRSRETVTEAVAEPKKPRAI